jgi:hypothetical protein
MTLTREYLPKLTIAILALSIALVFLSVQPSQVAASPAIRASAPHIYNSNPNWYNYTNDCNYYDWYYYYYGYPYYYCDYYSNYYYGYPYYYYYYGYPYYYSSYNYYSTPSSYTLTVNTDPSSLGTVTGGGTYTQGSSASFSVTQNTVQVSPNTRYVFSHWTGDYSGVGTSGTVTVNNAMKVTAVYQLQYYLSVNAQPQTAPTPQGANWYNAGDTATLQNGGQTIPTGSGSQLMFQGWSVDGGAPQSGSALNVIMNSPHSVTELYTQQYYLNVQSDQGSTTGTGWYNAGTTAQFYAATPISSSYGVSIVFNGWQGDSQSGSQSASVLMDGPKNVIATWRQDPTVLYLTIGAIIIAALLIVAGLIAFASRGRGGYQIPPQRAQTTTTSQPTQQGQTGNAQGNAQTTKKTAQSTETNESKT